MKGSLGGENEPPAAARPAAILLLGLALVVVSRLPFLPSHLLLFDNVNLALALDEFDPWRHQPQPPGYPLFVAEARALRWVLGSAELTFQVLGLLASGISVGLLGLLGREMFSPWTGRAACLLFLVNPVLWFSSVSSPLRPHLALVSIAVAYFCWRVWRGEARFLYPSALALGLGGGFRPAVMVLLAPLWLASAWKLTGSPRRLLGPCLAMALASSTWLIPLVMEMGGPLQTMQLLGGYFLEQSQQESLLLGGEPMSWSRMIGRLLIWNGLAVVAMLVALPFVRRRNGLLSRQDGVGKFLALWALPLLGFQFFLHIASPGHALSTVPIICLLAAVALEHSGKEPGIWGAAPRRESLLVVALLLNVLLFVAPFDPPARPAAFGIKRFYYSLRDAVLYGRFETSAGMLQHLDNSTSESLDRLSELRAAGPVALVVWKDAPMSWRQGTYYVRDLPFCVLMEARDPAGTQAQAVFWQFNRVLRVSSGNPARVNLPSSGRIVWLVNQDSLFQQELERTVPLQFDPPVFHTRRRDLPATFQVGDFVFQRVEETPHGQD